MTATRIILFGSMLLVPATARSAADEEFIKTTLARAIVTPATVLTDVQDFVEARIARVPEARTAEEWTRTADRVRADVHKRVIFRGEAAQWKDAQTGVVWLETIKGGPGYRIRKLRYEAIPGLWIPALLYEPESLGGKVPVVLNVNGHDSKGKTADYKQIRCINQARRGIIALNVEWFGMGQLATPGFGHGLINAIDLCGSGGIALHYLYMTRALDVLLAHEHADSTRVGVTGLSGGGWQTIFVSTLDPRVTLTDPVAGYSSFRTRVRHLSDLGDSEQTPCDLAAVADYATLTAMMAPHPTLLTFNAKDNCCFAAGHALPPLLDAARPVFRLFGKEANLRSHVNLNPGDHNYGLDNRQALYRLIGESWFANDSHFDPKEVPAEAEVKTADELKVELPAHNRDFHAVALGLSQGLPKPKLSAERAALREIVRPFVDEVEAERVGDDRQDELQAVYWRLRVGSTWSVPVVSFTRPKSAGATIVLADAGRKEMTAVVRELLDAGRRVIAVDPFLLGEAQTASHGYLFALLIGSVAERPLGIQAGQMIGVARWASKSFGDGPVSLLSVGPRTSVIAVIATALEEGIANLELREPLGSLKEPIEQSQGFASSPELFCFGLLESFDVRDIAALVAPRRIRVARPSERARREWTRLKVVYETIGSDGFRLD
jgi:hypothetical protein